MTCGGGGGEAGWTGVGITGEVSEAVTVATTVGAGWGVSGGAGGGVTGATVGVDGEESGRVSILFI